MENSPLFLLILLLMLVSTECLKIYNAKHLMYFRSFFGSIDYDQDNDDDDKSEQY